ncbi:MAG: tRNA dihydrouridine synthase DusB [Alphaproteobacteria bacterium]|nr:tRNA dihydrouridine synthase DusB [Alphaproteobacteria bacterium]
MKLTNLFSKEIPVFLAPMAGVTDAPFRRIVAEFGASAVVSEMISSEALVRNSQKTHKRLVNDSNLKIIQIVGADPKKMAESAKINEACGADIIDINMGCPAKKIINSEAGSALMKNEKLAVDIAKSVVNAVKIPVTIKMRLGWDSDHKNCLILAQQFEQVGIRMLTIHCRTRNQMYTGTAKWDEIFPLNDLINIPYLCNGDIKNTIESSIALVQSKASGIMIGRAALGRPWMLQQIRTSINNQTIPPTPTTEEQYRIVINHFNQTLDFYGELHGIKIFRKHFCWYSAGMTNASHFRERINQLESKTEVLSLIQRLYESV